MLYNSYSSLICICTRYVGCPVRVYAVGVAVISFVVALRRAVCSRDYARGLHSSRGSVAVRRRGPQRRKAGGVPGGVYDRSGEWSLVCVAWSDFPWASTWVCRSVTSGRGRSSSLLASQSLSHCTACEVVSGRHWIPRWTRSARRGGVLPRGDNSAGGLQKGEVSLLTRTSQVVSRSLDGLVILGGVRSTRDELPPGYPLR